MNAQAQTETTHEDRDNKGRFTKENRFGVGNPHGRRVAELRKLMLSRCTDEVLDKAMDALIRLVEQGDLQAIKLLFQYTVGKPAAPASPDHVNVDEWQLIRKSSEIVGATDLASIPDLQFTLDLVRAGRETETKRSIREIACEVEKANEADRKAEERREKRRVQREQQRAEKEARSESPSATASNGDVSHVEIAGSPSAAGSNGEEAPSPTGSNGGFVPQELVDFLVALERDRRNEG